MSRARGVLGASAGLIILGTWLGRQSLRQPASQLAQAIGDCEVVSGGFLAQPSNALSSLALVAAGVIMFDGSRSPRSVLGLATTLAGMGSALLHGTAWEAASALDALGVAIVIATVVGLSVERHVPKAAFTGTAGAVLLPAAAFTVLDGPDMIWLAAALSLGFAYEASRRPSVGLAWAATIAGVGMVAWYLGQTGAATCSPGSTFQYHAVWHVAAAAALLALGSHYERG